MPPGATAAGIIEERRRYEALNGVVTVSGLTEAVEAQPEQFPNNAAFVTWDLELAAHKQHQREIAYALASVITVTVEDAKPIRAIMAVRVESCEEMVWKETRAVVQDRDEFDQVLGDCEARLRQTADLLEELRRLRRRIKRSSRNT